MFSLTTCGLEPLGILTYVDGRAGTFSHACSREQEAATRLNHSESRGAVHLGKRSVNSTAKLPRAGFQARMGIVHFASQIAHSQVYHLVDRLIGREDAMIARHLAQRHIDRLNGIGGVDDLANVLWEGKERDHVCPVSSPRLADRRVEGIPFRGPSVPG